MKTKYIEIVFNNGSSRTFACDEVKWEYTPNTFYVELGHISYAIPYTSIKEIIFKERDADVSAITNNPKALEQEQFVNNTCVYKGLCEHYKSKVLDKIRAEIGAYQSDAFYPDDVMINKRVLLDIIDKYKESEDKE